jgi:hypothetical protein
VLESPLTVRWLYVQPMYHTTVHATATCTILNMTITHRKLI